MWVFDEMVFDETFLDENRQFHPNFDETVTVPTCEELAVMVGVIDTNDVWTCEPQQKGTARGSSGAVSEQRPPQKGRPPPPDQMSIHILAAVPCPQKRDSQADCRGLNDAYASRQICSNRNRVS